MASKRLKAGVEYGQAQDAEAKARGSRPGAIHEDTEAAREAKARAVKAADELHEIAETTRTGADGEKVTLLSPNPNYSGTDAAGVTYKDGKAENVDKALAEYLVASFEGYEIQGSSKK